jgi:hypothetical protein
MTEAQAQMDMQMRSQALNLAHQRNKPDATVAHILKDAEKLLEFMMAGGKVANPEQDDGRSNS